MHARSPFAFYAALAGLILCVPARSAPAQQALAPRTPAADVAALSITPPADSTINAVRTAGPTADAARVAVSQPTSHELKISSAAQRRAGLGQPVALMVVGGAALLTGLIIGDDAGTVIAVGGALVGLYGLYEYLQ
ncbi:MAG: hypothetical protein ACJ79A_10045 [Gemmatimonadaceae bacterium]